MRFGSKRKRKAGGEEALGRTMRKGRYYTEEKEKPAGTGKTNTEESKEEEEVVED